MLVAFGISVAFNVIGVWKVGQVSAQRTQDLHARLAETQALTTRLLNTEQQLRDSQQALKDEQVRATRIANEAVVHACGELNGFKAGVEGYIVSAVQRGKTTSLAILSAPSSTQQQRESALRAIASASETATAVAGLLAPEKCHGPF